MVGGFLALGIGIVADGYRSFKKQVILFIAFGLSMGVAGLLARKLLASGVPYSEFSHAAHLMLSSLPVFLSPSVCCGRLGSHRLCGNASLPLRLRRFVFAASVYVALPRVSRSHPANHGLGCVLVVLGFLPSSYHD